MTTCRGHFHIPEAFSGMKIGQLLAEIYAKNAKFVPQRVMKTRGAFIGIGACIGEFTVHRNACFLKTCDIVPMYKIRHDRYSWRATY